MSKKKKHDACRVFPYAIPLYIVVWEVYWPRVSALTVWVLTNCCTGHLTKCRGTCDGLASHPYLLHAINWNLEFKSAGHIEALKTIILISAGHINNLYNTCFWCLVQKSGLSAEQAEDKLNVSNADIPTFLQSLHYGDAWSP